MTADHLPGRATAEGTRRFAERFAALPGHFRCPDRLSLGSLGMGTRLGEPGGPDDLLYRTAVARALESGVNVFDTALAYRMQKSERNLGAALRRAIASGSVARDEVLVISKGGYLALDCDHVHSEVQAGVYLYDTYVRTGLVDPAQTVNGSHSLEPAFIRDQIERSRRNLGLATLDVYCVQNPELHLHDKGPDAFRHILRKLVGVLEQAVADGWIAAWGVSTWNGFFTPYTDKGHLSLSELFDVALEVGGADHHMRAIQFPYSVAMGEAAGLPSQFGGGVRPAGVLELLRDTGTAVFTTLPLVQGRAARGLPAFLREAFPELESDAQIALQFARSTPGVTTTLVGMRTPRHVQENLDLLRSAPARSEVIERLFEHAAA